MLLRRIKDRGKLDSIADGAIGDAASFETRQPLLPLARDDGSPLTMDGEHNLDIVALGRSAGPLGIEVKCGEKLVGKQFVSRYLVGPALSRHKPPRLCGSVPGLLEVNRRGGKWNLPRFPDQSLKVKAGSLDGAWILIARTSVIESLRPLGLGCQLVSIENLAKLAGGADVVNSAVLELIAGPTSFATRWRLD
jgi:hypothetical protein